MAEKICSIKKRGSSGGTNFTLSGSFISSFDVFIPKDVYKNYKYVSLSGEAARYLLRDGSGNYVNVTTNTDYLISDYSYQDSLYVNYSMLSIVSYTKPYTITLHN